MPSASARRTLGLSWRAWRVRRPSFALPAALHIKMDLMILQALLYHGSRYSTVDHRTAHTPCCRCARLPCVVVAACVSVWLVWCVWPTWYAGARLAKHGGLADSLSLDPNATPGRPQHRKDGRWSKPPSDYHTVLSARAHTRTLCAEPLARSVAPIRLTLRQCAYGMRRTCHPSAASLHLHVHERRLLSASMMHLESCGRSRALSMAEAALPWRESDPRHASAATWPSRRPRGATLPARASSYICMHA